MRITRIENSNVPNDYKALVRDSVTGIVHGKEWSVQPFANQAGFPASGEEGVIYIDETTKTPFFWDGNSYEPLSAPAIPETITTMVKNANGSFTYTSENGTQTILNQQFDVIANAQPTPTATGNTTNLNSIFKDTNGVTWAVDFNGEAIQLSTADIRYSKALFVDPINGLDSNTGSDNAPFKTIAKALTVADGSGFRIVLAPGVYAENPTISLANLDIVTLAGSDRGNTSIQGTVTFSHTSSSSGIQGIAMNRLAHTGAGALYVTDCQVNGTFEKTSTGYIEITDTQLQGTSGPVLSAGTGLIKDSLIKNMTISGASSGYTLKSNIIDADGTVTFSGGAFYNIQDNSGNIVTTAGVNMETGLIASGLSAALAKQYVTDFSNKLGMINPDTNASPTKYVSYNETTKRLEISNVPTNTTVSVTQNNTSGKQIGSVTVNGTTTNLFETLTSLGTLSYNGTTGVLSIPYTDENGTTNTRTVTIPVEIITTLTNTKVGNRIGTYTNESGVAVDINETITSIGTISYNSTTGVLTIPYIDEAGVTNNKTVTLPTGGASALWTSATTDPTATGNVGGPKFVENTVNGSKWYIDSTGVAKLIEGAADVCGTVFFNALTPQTATIFDDENPPITDTPSLKNLDCAVYVSSVDGSFWSSNGTTYSTKTYSYPIHEMDVRIATANQTSFTLTKTPIGGTGKVVVSRNGVVISDAFTIVGNVATYNPANNYNCVIDANDKLIFNYEAL
jgi:hypothetical protein